MAISYTRPDPSSPNEVASAGFPTGRRGFDQTEVRDFLRMVAAELARLQERERYLERELRAEQQRVGSGTGEFDEETATRLLGEEAAHILQAAREGAVAIRTRAEDGAARLLREATDEAQRLREEAEVEAARRRQDASADAEAELQMAKQQGREMVNEARAYRERVLSELARRRELARQQIEQLIHGRDRLLQVFERARLVAVDVMADLTPLGQPDEYVNLAPTTGPVPAMLPADPFVSAGRPGDLAADDDFDLAVGGDEARPPEDSDVSSASGIYDEASADGPSDSPSTSDAAADADASSTAAEAAVDEADIGGETAATGDDAREDDATEGGTAIDGTGVDGTGVDGTDVDGTATDGAAPVDEAAAGDTDVDDTATSSAEPGADLPGSARSDVIIALPEASPAGEADDEREPAPVVALFADGDPLDFDPSEDRHTLDDTTAVDSLFARLRAARAESIAERAAAGATLPPAAEPTADAAEPETDTDDDAPSPIRRREGALVPVITAAARKLKRVLADEQNHVLDTLRRKDPVRTLDALVPREGQHANQYADAIAVELMTAAVTGAASVSTASESKHSADIERASALKTVNEALSSELIAPLRHRLEASIDRADGDNAELATHIRAVYREWKTQRIDDILGDIARMAYGRGAFAVLKKGTPLVWQLDRSQPGCADCEDNSLAGPVPAGTAFPTGHLCAPAHAGCRCLVAPAPH